MSTYPKSANHRIHHKRPLSQVLCNEFDAHFAMFCWKQSINFNFLNCYASYVISTELNYALA